MMNNEDDYEFYACSDKMYERPQHNAHTVLVVLFAVIMVVGMVLFMLINAFAG
jgi:hypothetical protein